VLIEGTRIMRVQVVHHESNLFRLRVFRSQRLTELRELFLGPLQKDLRQSLSGQGLNGGKQCARPVFLIGVMLFLNVTHLQWERINLFADQKARAFIKAYDWVSRVV